MKIIFMKVICVILLVFFFLFRFFLAASDHTRKEIKYFFSSPSGKTEIAQFVDPSSKYEYVVPSGKYLFVSFVISNPPKNEDILLNLVYKHFQSFASSDTIEKYIRYRHEYYEETGFINRDYIAKRENSSFLYYIGKNTDNLLVEVEVDPKYNKQIITLYKKRAIEKEIMKTWRE